MHGTFHKLNINDIIVRKLRARVILILMRNLIEGISYGVYILMRNILLGKPYSILMFLTSVYTMRHFKLRLTIYIMLVRYSRGICMQSTVLLILVESNIVLRLIHKGEKPYFGYTL